MKCALQKLRHSLAPSLGLFLAVGAACLVNTPAGSQAAPTLQDPSNGGTETWDCVLHGHGENGITFITFSSDFTFTGFELLAPTENFIQPENDPRTGAPGGTPGRGNGSGATNDVLFGAGPFSGNWGFNLKGQFIGSFQRERPDTNEAVSFVGKVSFGKNPRLTMVGTQQEGQFTYTGIVANPTLESAKTIPEISGNWFGYTSVSNQLTLEEFALTDDGEFPGLFDLEGNGPNYSTEGVCLISAQGKIGFTLVETPTLGDTNVVERSTIGSYENTSKAITSKSTGAQVNENTVDFTLGPVGPVHFNASMSKQQLP